MILVIDNYDSFTYNLVQYLGELGAEIIVRRNDAVTLDDIKTMRPKRIVISPGPGRPDKAGISEDLVRAFGHKTPILGVCLGHQAIGECFGGKIVEAKNLMHGKTSLIHHDGKKLFKGVKNPFEATRYHSLIVRRDTLPPELEVSAWTVDANGAVDEIMGLRHRTLDIEGVQFHPESIASEHGLRIFENFLALAVQWNHNERRSRVIESAAAHG